MTTHAPRIESPLELAVEQVARQCRRRRLIYCGFRFGLASLALVLAFTLVLATLLPQGFARYPLLGVFLLAEGAAAWWLLLRPLRQPIDLHRTALLIDEKRPELENRIVSAVEFSEIPYDEQSSWLIARLQDDSWRAARDIPFQHLLDSRRVLRWAVVGMLAWLGVFTCVGLYRNLWAPDISFLRSARRSPAGTLVFTVEPGNVRLRRGESAVVRVLSEQTAHLVSILWRAPGGQWQTASMEQGASPKIRYHQFANLQSDLFYQVQFGSVASEVYHIAVWTPPRVDSIDLTYHYPDYLNLPPTETRHGGDITAVAGSSVQVAVHVNKSLKSARLALEKSPPVALQETQPNRWEGTLQVARDDVYRVELLDPEDATNEFAPEYRITAQTDDPPDIKIAFPRDDLDVTSLDEIPFEFKVDDDFGLGAYGIQIEVAGREPIRLALGKDTAPTTQSAEGRHTFMLETLNLTPGDLITWAAWAEDHKPGRAEFETLGYPYFLEIRPFRREFEEAVSDQSDQNRQQQQQQQQQGERNQPASNQKEVLIATWNLRREAKSLTQQEFDERLSKIKEAQREVKGRVAEQGASRSAADSAQALESIDKALAALEAAQWPDPSARLSEAIRHMQMAHRQLLRARPQRSQVQMQMARNASGSQNQANRREIQQLELRRNRNFYEQERRVQQQREATQRAVNDLKDLAQRQRMINEEINKLISEMQQAEPERRQELARQLERLREEERRALQQLDQAERNVATGNMDNRQARDTSRSLQDARRQMTRSLDSMQRSQLQQARAAGSRAVRALGEAEEALQRLSRDAAAERMEELQQRMRAMGEREEKIQQQIGDLKRRHELPGSLRQDEQLDRERQEVVAEKGNLAQEFRDTLEEAADLTKGAEKSQELMTRRLGDWLRETSREEIPEYMEGSQELVEYGIWDPALQVEQQIREKLDRAERNLAEVAQGAVRDDLEGMRRALDELRDLRDAERNRRSLAQARDGEARNRDPSNNAATAQREQGAQRDANRPDNQANTRGSRNRQQESGARDRQGQRGANARGSRDQEASRQASSNERSPSQDQSRNGRGGRGAWDDWLAPRSDEEMRRFLERDSRDWTDRIRDAEALLPDENGARRRLEGAREALVTMRRHGAGLTSRPDDKSRFDLFKEMVGVPLALAAEDLERQIRKREDTEKLILTDEDAVPEQYRKRVADYYEALSESKEK